MEKGMSNAEQFIAIYNEIDDYMRIQLREKDTVSHTRLIGTMASKGYYVFRNYGKDLEQYAKLRNAIVHNPNSKQYNPIAEPHEIVVLKYQEIFDKVLNPPLALEKLAIKRESIYTTTLHTNTLDVMKTMNSKTYTHVPVIVDEKLVGVFSENTLFSYIADKEVVFIDELTINDFIDYLPIHDHVSEIFVFVPRTITVYEIEDIFRREFKDNKKISAIFITEKGREDEKLLGIITPWDIAGYVDNNKFNI